MINEFPKIEVSFEIHPFFADLMNVLYDKDHYKLALGQLNTCKHLIDNIARDYVRLLKHADSLYRCKMLKKAALGRMVTIMKRQVENLQYLEQVRQHISRMPSIDPNMRTLLVCADVEVQPYAFTTKSLYVGHTDYNYLRWQVIDTPGILDHSLEERNTIEMQSITALAHIRSCIVYIMDVSQQCGYSIDDQFSLFRNIKPLFANKPIIICVNKTDVRKIADLEPEYQQFFEDMKKENVVIHEMSNKDKEGVVELRNVACDLLLAHRVEYKMKSKKGHDDISSRLHRPPCIPAAVLNKKNAMKIDGDKKKLERDIELELGDDYILDLKKNFDLHNPTEKYDIVPELWNGRNIADYIDPEIEAKLEALEREEEERINSGYYDIDLDSPDEELEEIQDLAKKIRHKKGLLKFEQRMNNSNKPSIDRTAKKRERSLSRFRGEQRDLGVDISSDEEGNNWDDSIDQGLQRPPLKKVRTNNEGDIVSNKKIVPRDREGIVDVEMRTKARKLVKKGQKKFNQDCRKGEADRHIPTTRSKHLLAGKRGGGKTQRR
ncbi:hypothetical protein RI129_000003 [Pyrocoelia pectoralis]|uniref:OBG-type G domain-containing protein n=1 Tax=Pyrocoelia pectoralis TaxID=417401 RepID=A0AAN7UX12_9COLE